MLNGIFDRIAPPNVSFESGNVLGSHGEILGGDRAIELLPLIAHRAQMTGKLGARSGFAHLLNRLQEGLIIGLSLGFCRDHGTLIPLD
jgi:hypothetical protein